MMAFGKDMPETPHGPKILHRAKREPRAIPEDVDPLDERKSQWNNIKNHAMNDIKRCSSFRSESSTIYARLCLTSFFAVVNAIQERMEFLNDMESLGMDNKYRPIIQQEIAQKLRLIEAMDKEMPEETRKKITEFMYERPPPKPFPMGDLDEN